MFLKVSCLPRLHIIDKKYSKIAILWNMDPFHKTVMTCLTVISIVNTRTFFVFLYIFFKYMYIYNTIIRIISPLHQITKKLVNANARVFLMQRLWEGWYIWHSSLFWLSLSVTIVELFFCFLSKWECKKYISGTLPFTALQVNPTMTTSTAEKPGNVKKVHYYHLKCFLFEYI